MMYLYQIGQNLAIGLEDRVQTRLFHGVIWAWWPWKVGQDHEILIISLVPPVLVWSKCEQEDFIDLYQLSWPLK